MNIIDRFRNIKSIIDITSICKCHVIKFVLIKKNNKICNTFNIIQWKTIWVFTFHLLSFPSLMRENEMDRIEV